MSTAPVQYSSYQISSNDAKRTFDENYLRILFNQNADIDISYVIDFLHQAQLSGANPAQKQIYLTKYYNKTQGRKVGVVVFSYHFFLSQANLTGEMRGLKVETVVEEIYNPITKQTEKELVSTATVTREGRGSTVFKARWSEFYNKNSPQWQEKPYIMLEKTAIANVLRWAFPESLSGMFIDEEMSEDNYEGVYKVNDPSAINAAAATADKREKVLANAVDTNEIQALAAAVEELLGQVKTYNLTEKTGLLKKLFIKNVSDLYKKSVEELNKDKEMLEMLISNQAQDVLKNSPAVVETTSRTVSEKYSFSVSGNTAGNKNELKAYGGKWNPHDKTWDFTNVPADYYLKVKEIEGIVIKLAA